MIFTTAALLLGLASSVLAQATTNTTCIQDQSWSYNDKQQSPCLVAAYLGAACNHGQWNIIAINPTQYYEGPEGSSANDCQCSTVAYAMTAACAACQNATWQTWSVWSQSCTIVYPSIFIEAINLNTSVPGWAYGDFITPGTFETAQASANSTALPSTGTAPLTATPTNTASSSSSPSATTTASSSSGSKKSNTGAIAGGVVGGVVLLGLIIGLILFFMRRRRTHTAPSAAFSEYANSQAPIHSPTLMSEPYSPKPFNPSATKFYNPDDPTTYPNTPPPGTIHTTDRSSPAPSRPGAPGQYNYVPEL